MVYSVCAVDGHLRTLFGSNHLARLITAKVADDDAIACGKTRQDLDVVGVFDSRCCTSPLSAPGSADPPRSTVVLFWPR